MVIDEIGEVVVEIQSVVDQVKVGLGDGILPGVFPVARQAVAPRFPLVGGVEGAVSADQSLIEQPVRSLVGGVPSVEESALPIRLSAESVTSTVSRVCTPPAITVPGVAKAASTAAPRS